MADANGNRILIEEVKRRARPLAGDGVDVLLHDLSHSRIVMLGESTHGSEEFYEWRRRLSSRLISEHGFRLVAVEGDWPACWKLNRYVTGRSKSSARTAFSAFRRWPNWIWANTSVLKFAEWMRARNARLENPRERVGIFGMDVYSLFESIDAILKSLERSDPEAAEGIRELYGCLRTFGKNEKAYARSLVESPQGCEDEVDEALRSLLRLRKHEHPREDEEETLEFFNIEQNARVARDAELYYRTLIGGTEDSWNVRDRHMLDTLERLLAFHGPSSKVIVWAHNQHVGDYRGGASSGGKQVSLGGLARDRWGEGAVSLVGFGTYKGEVTAAHAWGEAPRKMEVPPGRRDSYEAIFHEAGHELGESDFYVPLWEADARESPLGKEKRPQRSIGVVYYPQYEHFGNYTDTVLAKRFDAFVYLETTSAVRPLSPEAEEKPVSFEPFSPEF
jgi:erythromycin esterase-like protein